MSRASKQTISQIQKTVYSDFMSNLDTHPLSGDIARVTNVESVKQALKNLILISYGEKPFQPTIGSNVYKSLFEPLDGFTINDIKQHIRDTIDQNEKRVKLLDVQLVLSEINDNAIDATITFYVININQTASLNLILKRVR